MVGCWVICARSERDRGVRYTLSFPGELQHGVDSGSSCASN
jgi:hypothetical protein